MLGRPGRGLLKKEVHMIKMKNVLDNGNIVQKEKMGCFTVVEHKSDRSVTPATAEGILYGEGGVS